MTYLHTLFLMIALFLLNFNIDPQTPEKINIYYLFSSVMGRTAPHISFVGGGGR